MTADPATIALGPGAPIWERLRAARHRLLFLDYDGTLAPFRARREDALPLPATLSRLRMLAAEEGTTVTIVSGRPLAELEPLLLSLPFARVGEHGWEEREVDAPMVHHPIEAAVEAALDAAAASLAEDGYGERVERKRTGLVVHVRGLGEDAAAETLAACEALLAPWPGRVALRLDHPNGGLELRAIGRDKGRAVRERIERAGPGAFAVYVGDDRTDEDAFAIVRETGLGIRVGAADVPTLAAALLPDPAAIPEFLDRWIHETRPARAGERNP
jgi:trehalose-phosphatase